MNPVFAANIDIEPLRNVAWWLSSCLFMVGFGSCLLLLTQSLSGGKWMDPLRPAFRSMALLLPLSVACFAALFFLTDVAYWMHPTAPHFKELAEKREAFLNTPFFIFRIVIYFIFYTYVTFHVREGSNKKIHSAPTLLFSALTTIFFVSDFLMLRTPPWWSSAFPYTIMIGGALMALSLSIFFSVSSFENEDEKLRRSVGSLLLANLILFLYFILMDLIITYAGDLPPKRALYSERMTASAMVPILAGFALFAVPSFFALLQLKTKINLKAMRRISLGLTAFVTIWMWWFMHPFS